MDEKEDNSMHNQVLLFAGIIIVLIGLKIYSTKFTQRLREGHIVVCGTILDMRSGKGVNVIYEFWLDDKRFEYNRSTDPTTLANYKKGITKILVAVQKKDPGNNRVLGESEDYEELNVTLGDTLGVPCR